MMVQRLVAFLVASAAVLVGTTVQLAAQTPAYDLLLQNGRVYDGSGNPWVYADVAVKDGRIAAVGDLEGETATRVIDARNLVVMPGIIDLHSHAAGSFNHEDPAIRATINNLTQGITTIVPSEGSAWPRGTKMGDLVAKWKANGMGTNAALFVGFGSVRNEVLGSPEKTPTSEQLDQMRALVREAMEAGAFGIGGALDYWSGHFFTTDELIALTKEVAPYGGIYASHMRSEGTRSLWWVESDPSPRVTLLDALDEIIRIGKETGVRVHVSHIKSTGVPFWGKSREATALMERAREEGVQITADQYPYDASGPDRNTELFKPEPYFGETAGGTADAERKMKARIQAKMQSDPLFARQVRKDVLHEILARGGADRMIVTAFAPQASYVGKTLADIAAARNEDLYQTAVYLQLDNDATIRSHSMSEEDIEHFLTRDYIAPATDGFGPTDDPTHPRTYGTFPRVIRRYVLDKEVITFPAFVRKVTSLPASILGLEDRGWIKTGYKADLLVLDLENVHDRATFDNSTVLSEGVEFVIVNGRVALEDGEFTGSLAGEVLLRPRTGRRPSSN